MVAVNAMLKRTQTFLMVDQLPRLSRLVFMVGRTRIYVNVIWLASIYLSICLNSISLTTACTAAYKIRTFAQLLQHSVQAKWKQWNHNAVRQRMASPQSEWIGNASARRSSAQKNISKSWSYNCIVPKLVIKYEWSTIWRINNHFHNLSILNHLK